MLIDEKLLFYGGENLKEYVKKYRRYTQEKQKAEISLNKISSIPKSQVGGEQPEKETKRTFQTSVGQPD